MSSLPNNEFSESIFKKEDLIDGFSHCLLHCHKQLFVSFEISGGSYNPSQNTLRLINKFEKCMLSFMETLIANFI